MKTSSLGRLFELGSLVGRVGASVATDRVAGLARSESSRQDHQVENLLRNARRIVATLGELKGAAMKVGQMLSLHEGLLPPEVAAVLHSLQKEAPNVPFEVMQYEVRGELEDFDRIFHRLYPEPLAAASIGQVHRGLLHDGRRVAVKIQYPLIDRIVRADLDNLKLLLQTLFSFFTKMEFEPVWRELRDRLLEELDYTHEAKNMERMAALWEDTPEVVIPAVVEEATSQRVLTMERVEGLSPKQACAAPRELRDAWGAVLFEVVMRGLLDHRLLHADPNFANFAFLEDGRVIVYDFGCVKEIPDAIAAGYRSILSAALEERPEDIPDVLFAMGVALRGGVPISVDTTTSYFELFSQVIRREPPYTFGENQELYRQIMDLGMTHWQESVGMSFPEDIVFVDRTLAGHLGNLRRLRATGPWRELISRYVVPE